MAESIAAQIQIGGPIPRKRVAGLIGVLKAGRLRIDWDGPLARIGSEAELVDLAHTQGRGGTLFLTDNQAASASSPNSNSSWSRTASP